MGGVSSRDNKFRRLTIEENAVIKEIWSGVETNPQYHANVIFLSFCEAYPQYTKYFTTETNVSLTIDAYTSAKFRIIIETLRYLLIDFNNKPNDFDNLISYVGMMHKDMNLTQIDMINFGDCLVSYLTNTFPTIMTDNYREIFLNYIYYILNEVTKKIQEFQLEESLEINHQDERKKTFVNSLFHKEKLIYGHKKNFWNERKRKWHERLELWELENNDKVKEKKFQSSSSSSSSSSSISSDEKLTPKKSKANITNLELLGSAGRFLESYGITVAKDSLPYEPRGPKVAMMQVKRAAETHLEIVNATSLVQQLEAEQKDDLVSLATKEDSSARQRRRRRQQRHTDKS
ncbi:hypothetical protein HCN44_005882 [Aphidius gifuensis]|uniref:Globin family profile domain-containing protein n=1 Tax=Aphidius gifuensis TaxID=684658 RepID=A0A834XUP7_APHGI|nr:uncharacterized protein LOC122851063 [Aphidius gifuensis]KAF7993101.1 hypothetical protein HCN44_005882 [Aphidius gifuensis]